METLVGRPPRPFCLAPDPTTEQVILAYEGTSGRLNAILLLWIDAEREAPEIYPAVLRGWHAESPSVVRESDGTVHLAWVEGQRTFDIWTGSAAFPAQELPGRCLSPCDGSSHFYPKLLLDSEGNLHAAWMALQAESGQDYSLRYRNTANPVSLSFWKRIGMRDRGAGFAVLYAIVYTGVMVAWTIPLLNLGTIAVVVAAILLLRRYMLGAVLERYRYLGLLVPCSLLFAALHPANPIFIDPPLVHLEFAPLWFEGALFVVPTVLTLFLVRLSRLDVDETMPLIGAMLFWTVCFATLAALPASLLGVYQ